MDTSVKHPLVIRSVNSADIPDLLQLELDSFDTDRLSKRRMKHWVMADNRIFLVATLNAELVGYCLILLHKGTRMARLYSIATSSRARGQGVGKTLLLEGEEQSSGMGRLFMRLEVAKNNSGAIALYEKLGYTTFGAYPDYYDDHQDALRMQKRIRYIPGNLMSRNTPWYQQTTEFTCGPASLMMAMASLDKHYAPSQGDEMDIWREATTIFMTSGHGGSHPVGLALAAHKRGFAAQVYISTALPLFLEGVRNPEKKAIMELVDKRFRETAGSVGVEIRKADISQGDIEDHLNFGGAVIMLISTYRMDGRKSPHWVTITGIDDQCLYLHDPDPSYATQITIDCQHIPIARKDFIRMSSFGRQKLRTAVLISSAAEKQ